MGPGRTWLGPLSLWPWPLSVRGRGSGQSPQDAAGWDPPPTLLPLNPAGEEWSGLLSQDRTWGRRSCSWKRDPSCRGSLPPWGPIHPGTPAQPRPSDLRGEGSPVGRAAPAHCPRRQAGRPICGLCPGPARPSVAGGLSGSVSNTRRGLHPGGLRGHGRPWCGREHGAGQRVQTPGPAAKSVLVSVLGRKDRKGMWARVGVHSWG